MARHLFAISAAFFLFVVGFAPAASAQCVNGTITAETQVGGPYDGLYKYTISINWTTNQGISNVTLDCGFGECPEAACAQGWFFDDPAGTGTGGSPDNCNFDLTGEFNCEGNPSIGLDHPILKWDAVNGDCEAEATGTATLCFYTAAPPAQGTVPVILIKNGQNVCDGEIVGACPSICATPVDARSWSQIKTLMH